VYAKLKLITGNANRPLAEEVARYAGIPLADIDLFKFSNDESFVKINDNVRGADVFVIQPTCRPVNDNLMDLLIIIDALKRASAQRINCVIPYYAYARKKLISLPNEAAIPSSSTGLSCKSQSWFKAISVMAALLLPPPNPAATGMRLKSSILMPETG